MKIGQQLYSFHKECETEEALAQTLKTVRKIGYEYVQLSGICECEAKTLDSMLKETGLKGPVCHANTQQLIDDPKSVIAYYDSVGCHEIGIGSMPVDYRYTVEGVKAFLKDITPAIDILKDSGRVLHYHNHAFDLAKMDDGSCHIDHLLEKDGIFLLADTYWVHMGGYNEVEYLRSIKGKCTIVHFKDWELDKNTPRFAPVGRGNLDWDGIYKVCEEIGVEYAFVEQDKTFDDETPTQCATISFNNMKAKGWL